MKDVLHFLASETQTICGDCRIGLTVTRDIDKVLKCKNPEIDNANPGIAVEGACQPCANALAVTTFKKPKAKPVEPEVVQPKVK